MNIKAGELAYWYFRLNGFFTFVNFIVHPDERGPERTDVDILGVRFPHRAELLRDPMQDDHYFTQVAEVIDKPYLIIAEVKRGECDLNGPWTRPQDENMERVLRAVGIIPSGLVPNVAQALYKKGFWTEGFYYLSLFCIGGRESQHIRLRYPKVPQVTWDQALEFIFNRFKLYPAQKASHRQWDNVGRQIWDCCLRHEVSSEFIKDVKVTS